MFFTSKTLQPIHKYTFLPHIFTAIQSLIEIIYPAISVSKSSRKPNDIIYYTIQNAALPPSIYYIFRPPRSET